MLTHQSFNCSEEFNLIEYLFAFSEVYVYVGVGASVPCVGHAGVAIGCIAGGGCGLCEQCNQEILYKLCHKYERILVSSSIMKRNKKIIIIVVLLLQPL